MRERYLKLTRASGRRRPLHLTQLKCLLKSASGLAGLGSSSLLGPDLVRVLVAGRHGAFVAINNCALPASCGRSENVLCQSWLREANFRGENCGCTPGVFVIVHLAHLHLARERITHRHAIVSRHGQDCVDEGIVPYMTTPAGSLVLGLLT